MTAWYWNAELQPEEGRPAMQLGGSVDVVWLDTLGDVLDQVRTAVVQEWGGKPIYDGKPLELRVTLR